MKIYTNSFNANSPSPVQINIPNFSSAKVGFDFFKNGEKINPLSSEVTLVNGDTVISCDGIYNGYHTFPIDTQGDNADATYTVSCDKGWEVDVQSESVSIEQFPVKVSYTAYFTKPELINSMKGKKIRPNAIELSSSNPTKKITQFTLSTPSRNLYARGNLEGSDAGKWTYTPFGIVDELVVPNDLTAIRIDVLREPNVNYSITSKFKYGEPYKGTFQATVNSVKSSQFDVDKDTIQPQYVLPVASSSTLGGVKINGNGLAIASDGTLSASAYTGPKFYINDGSGEHITDTLVRGDILISPSQVLQSIVWKGVTYVNTQNTSRLLMVDIWNEGEGIWCVDLTGHDASNFVEFQVQS